MCFYKLSLSLQDYSEAYMCVPKVKFSPIRNHDSVLLDTCRYKNHEICCFKSLSIRNMILYHYKHSVYTKLYVRYVVRIIVSLQT